MLRLFALCTSIIAALVSVGCAAPAVLNCPVGRQRAGELCVRDEVVDFVNCVHENQGSSIEIDQGKSLSATVDLLGIKAATANDLRDRTKKEFTAQTPENAKDVIEKCYGLTVREVGASSHEADIPAPSGPLPSCKQGNVPPELVCAGEWTLVYSTPGGACATEGMPQLRGASHFRPISELRRLAMESDRVMITDLPGSLDALEFSTRVRRIISTASRPIENLRAGLAVSSEFNLSDWVGDTTFLRGAPPAKERLPAIWHSANCRSCLHIIPTSSGPGSTDSGACLSRWSFSGPDSPLAVWVK